MGSLAQNVGENPRHVPWNDKNMEFEGRQQNMMGYSCMKAVYKHTPYLHDREKYYYCTRHSAKKITNKETTVDTIHCLAVMELARSVFAHEKQFYLLRYLACENSHPSSLRARVAFREKVVLTKRHSGGERRRTAVFAGYVLFCRRIAPNI